MTDLSILRGNACSSAAAPSLTGFAVAATWIPSGMRTLTTGI